MEIELPAGQRAAERLRDLAAGVASAYGCRVETQLLPQVPGTRRCWHGLHCWRWSAFERLR